MMRRKMWKNEKTKKNIYRCQIRKALERLVSRKIAIAIEHWKKTPSNKKR